MKTSLAPLQYVQPEWFRREQETIFSSTWQLAGLAVDVAHDQDYITLDVPGDSVVVQNFRGTLRAFRNVCSHRQSRIRREPSGSGPLRCPYHGWTYDEGGVPTGIPRRENFAELEKTDLRSLALDACAVETIGPLVFVNPSPTAPILAQQLGPLYPPISEILAGSGSLLDRHEWNVAANWKVLVENSLEGYHVPFVHPTTIFPLHFEEVEIAYCGGSSLSRFKARTPRRKLDAIDYAFPDRPLRLDGYLHGLIFPTTTVATAYGNVFIVTRTLPLGPASSRVLSIIFSATHRESTQDHESVAALMNRSNIEFIRKTFDEDTTICEGVQLGCSEARRTGILSSEEARVAAFQQACAAGSAVLPS